MPLFLVVEARFVPPAIDPNDQRPDGRLALAQPVNAITKIAAANDSREWFGSWRLSSLRLYGWKHPCAADREPHQTRRKVAARPAQRPRCEHQREEHERRGDVGRAVAHSGARDRGVGEIEEEARVGPLVP